MTGVTRASMVAVCLSWLVAVGCGRAEEEAEKKALEERFRAVCAEMAVASEEAGNPTVRGREGWLFFGPELRHLGVGPFWGEDAVAVSRATKPEWADPLPAIVDFHRQLEAAGIILILAPVPPKAVIYPDMLSPDFVPGQAEAPVRLDASLQAFYRQLREQGVRVLDLTEALLEARRDGDPVFCRQDTHWSGRACELAAARMAREIESVGVVGEKPETGYVREARILEMSGDLRRGLGDETVPAEKVEVQVVTDPNLAGGSPVPADRASPVLLLGDSYTLVFHAGGEMHANGAGLPDHLAFKLGRPVDLIGTKASGSTSVRVTFARKLKKPEYRSGKKVVVWCFGAREFTEGPGWRPIRLPLGDE